MAGCWPPPACPGSHQALLEMLGSLPPAEELDFGELFAGQGNVGLAMGELGYHGRALDKDHLAAMDFLQPQGLVLALRVALSIRPGGTFWLAPPCDSWVWLNRCTAGRHICIAGDLTKSRIVSQNALAERLALLMAVCLQRGVTWIVEQPASTLLWHYPAMQQVLQQGQAQACRLEMGAFGGSSQKPTVLMGTAPYLARLERTCTPEEKAILRDHGVQTTVRMVDASGKVRAQGTSSLKGTQAYPWGFGKAHALAFAEAYGPPQAGGGQGSGAYHARAVAALLETHPGFKDAWWLRDFLGDPF